MNSKQLARSDREVPEEWSALPTAEQEARLRSAIERLDPDAQSADETQPLFTIRGGVWEFLDEDLPAATAVGPRSTSLVQGEETGEEAGASPRVSALPSAEDVALEQSVAAMSVEGILAAAERAASGGGRHVPLPGGVLEDALAGWG
jgi:hypothetical protein